MTHSKKLIGTLIVLLATSLAAQNMPKQSSTPAGMRLEWTHFIDGSAGAGLFEQPVSVLEPDGMLYFGGVTYSRDFPTTPDAVQTKFSGIQDAFLVKFDTRQPRVVYSTMLGGTKEEMVRGPCVDRVRNNIIMMGSTGSADFPTTDDALIKQFPGPDFMHADGFLTILGDDGRKLSYSTFVGGPQIDFGLWRVFVEPSGEIFASGHASSLNFLPADVIRPKGFKNGDGTYVMKLDAKGQRILSARLMGDFSSGHDVQRLSSGDYLIAGNTTNPRFSTTNGAFDSTYHGGTSKWREEGGDIYITQLSADLKTVAFSTLFGGSGDEAKPQVATLPSGDFFVFGFTTSKDLPVTADAIQKTMESKQVIFLARFSGDGRQLKYCTYLGGKSVTTERCCKSLVYDGNARLYAAWMTNSPDCPVTPDAAQMELHGGNDVFLLALNINNNSLAYGSYLGGSSICLACDEKGTLYAIGNANSEDFPIGSRTTGVTGIRKDGDIFISKFSINPASADSGHKPSHVTK